MLDLNGKVASGSIINTSSVSGLRAEFNMTAYGVSKAGLAQLSSLVALQWGKHGIRCNAVAPGLVLSPAGLGLPEDVREMYVRHSMTPYVGRPEDIAPVVAFLASDESRYVTGEVIRVDGGIANIIPIVADYRDWTAAAARQTQ